MLDPKFPDIIVMGSDLSHPAHSEADYRLMIYKMGLEDPSIKVTKEHYLTKFFVDLYPHKIGVSVLGYVDDQEILRARLAILHRLVKHYTTIMEKK